MLYLYCEIDLIPPPAQNTMKLTTSFSKLYRTSCGTVDIWVQNKSLPTTVTVLNSLCLWCLYIHFLFVQYWILML